MVMGIAFGPPPKYPRAFYFNYFCNKVRKPTQTCVNTLSTYLLTISSYLNLILILSFEGGRRSLQSHCSILPQVSTRSTNNGIRN